MLAISLLQRLRPLQVLQRAYSAWPVKPYLINPTWESNPICPPRLDRPRHTAHIPPSSSGGCAEPPTRASSASWSEEWRRVGLGAHKADPSAAALNRLLFVQTGFGCDQHGDRAGGGATKAAVRACRNAIEFNSLPGAVEVIPGGRKNMLLHVKLGVPERYAVDLDEVAKVFPYGRLLPIDVESGGLAFGCGRVVPELGDTDDTAVIVCAAVSVGYHDPGDPTGVGHRVWDTRDGH